MAGSCEGALIAVALPGSWCCRVAVALLVAVRAVAKGVVGLAFPPRRVAVASLVAVRAVAKRAVGCGVRGAFAWRWRCWWRFVLSARGWSVWRSRRLRASTRTARQLRGGVLWAGVLVDQRSVIVGDVRARSLWWWWG